MAYIDYEGDKDRVYSEAGRGETLSEVMNRRFSRRAAVAAGAVAGATIVVGTAAASTPEASPSASQAASPAASPVAGEDTLTFGGLTLQSGDETVVADGYTVVPFLRWGDPLFPDSPEFDYTKLTAEAQAKQVGYNCDYIGFISLPLGSNAVDHGLLVVNHEYTNPEMMFAGYLQANPEYTEGSEDIPEFLVNTTKDMVDTELEAHGLSVVEVKRAASGAWEVVLDSTYNRRITATTPTVLTGPAAGNEQLKSKEDTTGTKVIGTLNNCAGGVTPWGTVVSGEENFNQYFGNLDKLKADDPVAVNHARYGLPEGTSERQWETFYDRFDLAKDPNEPLRFGWGIEIDPLDPTSTPKKRTALGRFKHEGITSHVSTGGKVAVYSGDDERFDYAYKFVTAKAFDPDVRENNLDLLDEGTLYVARFNDDGSGDWLPLVYGENGLDESNGFTSQGDVLIFTRHAGDVLGATKMDRPEDFETNPVTGKVYLVLTNNTRRGTEDKPATDEANPRAENATGHIIEITETNGDHASTTFAWDIFLLAGDPADESTYFAGFPKDKVSPIASPDNITFDTTGNLWISTDGLPNSFEGKNDGIFAVPVDGANRGYLRQFFSSVSGAECSGPIFNPDSTALWISIQHPGEGGSFEEQTNHWPDGEGSPRPTVVLVTRNDSGVIGS
ncbi:MAG: PhoX family phosphatase [Thermomicrobiales bacterium]